MSRARYRDVIQTAKGSAVTVVPNATVTVYEPGTTTLLAQTMYESDSGVITKPNPFVTDALGNVEFYLIAAQRVKVKAALTGGDTVTTDLEAVLPDPTNLVDRAAPGTIVGGTFNSPTILTPSGDIVTPASVTTLTNKIVSGGTILGSTLNGIILAPGTLIRDAGAQVYNCHSVDFAGGAKGDNSTDDYAAINACFGAVRAAGGTMFIPPGIHLISQPVNGCFVGSPQKFFSVRGASPDVSVIQWTPTSNVWSSKPVFDLTSSYSYVLEDFSISAPSNTNLPGCGILMHSGSGLGSNSDIRNVHVNGNYVGAPLFVYAFGDCVFYHCAFQNNLVGGYAVILSGVNGLAAGVTMTSQYDPTHFLTGIQNVGDHTFIACEIHNEGLTPNPGYTNQASVYLNGAGSIRFIGGPFSNNGAAHFELHGNATYNTNGLSIYSSQLYKEAGATPALVFDFRDGSLVTGITVVDAICTANAVFGSSNGSFYQARGVKFLTDVSINNVLPKIADFGAGSANYNTFTDSIFFCSGGAFKVPGNITNSVTLINPGAVTSNNGGYNHFNERIGLGANDAAAGNHTHASTIKRVPVTSLMVASLTTGQSGYGWSGAAVVDASYGKTRMAQPGTLRQLSLYRSDGAPGGSGIRAQVLKNGSAIGSITITGLAGDTVDLNTAFGANDELQMVITNLTASTMAHITADLWADV